MAAKSKSTDISLETLLETGAHFGHQHRRWNPKMEKYLYAIKDGIYVFDLIKTHAALTQALEVIKKAVKDKKKILIVGTKKQAKEKVKEIAEATNCYYVSERWLGGTLTNFEQIRASIAKLKDLESKLKTAKSLGYTKKERLMLKREVDKQNLKFGGILEMESLPELIIIIDTHRENTAVTEANKLGIETIGVVDSNADPDLVDYVIPMNDDATKALEYVLDLIKQALS